MAMADPRTRGRTSGILARPTSLARLVAAAEVELLGEPLLDEVVDRGVQRIQATQLLALELGKRSIDPWNSRRHWRSFEDMPTCPTSGYKLRAPRPVGQVFFSSTTPFTERDKRGAVAGTV